MIVVDTNVLAYLYLPGDRTAQAEALYERDDAWAVPVLWRSEFRNILAGCLRRDQLQFEQALALLSEAEALVAGREYDVSSLDVMELVRGSDCSAYDCEFVALAKSLGVALVTADAKLLKTFPRVAIALGAG
jgi:predicted nucleic acid-binding protein